MNAIVTELTALGWTNSPAYTLTSPARSDVCRMSITVAKVSATQVSYVVKDHAGRLVNNDTLTKQTISLGAIFTIYSGARYCWVVASTGTASIWGCGFLNREPDDMDKPWPVYFATYGPILNSGDTSHNNWYEMFVTRGSSGATPASSGVVAIVSLMSQIVSNLDHFTQQNTMLF